MDLQLAHRQSGQRIRFDWGPSGAEAIVDGADYAVVVDVLSFTTTLSVAVERGIAVYPYRWQDERATGYAAERAAVLAVGRFEQDQLPVPVSPSPAAMAAVDGVERIVLPSPNGSAISFRLRDSGATVIGACLRNAAAVGRWLAPRLAGGATLAVVAAGERWPDGTLRPAVEDLWGAGAVLDGCRDFGLGAEAAMAAEAYLAVRDRLPAALADCASGRELAAAGFAADVALAAETGASDVVPVLDGEAYVPAS
ncbi:2-phosphosulfolactate phosphatase [Microlunatus parietis]|uniref:Probable 2-phosphosulfolactate phosphatase n=1 Tax=Microlunatus parietis TaxID=682979 RepID=A0A7Y9I674_9ACTN|nr:2-phosphosulfolactate phosphatase [Microlunatus parietis]NYE70776.1 2-phosphosulfolactate phosphatase [Microlunatus parietis]